MLSSIIITKNEQAMIEDCLVSLEFSDEILVVDTGNTDNTNTISKAHGAKIVKSSKPYRLQGKLYKYQRTKANNL